MRMSKSLLLRWEVEERSPFWIIRKGSRSFLIADGRKLTRMQDWIIRLGFDVFGIILFLRSLLRKIEPNPLN